MVYEDLQKNSKSVFEKEDAMFSILIWLVVCVAFTFLMCRTMKPNSDHSRRTRRLILSAKIALVGVVYLSPLYYQYPNPGRSDVVTFNTGHMVRHPYGMFAWIGSDFSVLPRGPIDFRGSVTALTANPKVRKITYDLVPRIVDGEKFLTPARRHVWPGPGYYYLEFYSRFQNPQNVEQEIAKVVAHATFEFNNTHSRELSQFYDPMDMEQLKEIRSIVEPWFNDRLAKDGVSVTLVAFDAQ